MFCKTKPTREEAWFTAIEHLIKQPGMTDLNVVLEIESPMTGSDLSRKIKRDFDALLGDANEYSINTVAETIFPGDLYVRTDIQGVYETYPEDIYPTLKKQQSCNRGTYAYRLVRGFNSKNKPCNPLQNIINRMKSEIANPGPKKSAYEISLDDVESIPIDRNDNTYMGFPCLSHLSFKLMKDENKVHLTAMYRKHNYVQKTLGNLLGLARLLHCVAREVGVDVGKLVCHSTYAEIETQTGLTKTVIKEFIKDINEYKHENGLLDDDED